MMAERLVQCRCDHLHQHAHLEGSYKGKPLTSYAETYPRKMCRVIAEVIHRRVQSQKPSLDIFSEFDDEMESADPAGPADVDRADEESTVSKQRIQAMIRKLHVNTGHASNEQLLRLAHRCQVSKEVKPQIKEFRCAICDEHKVPASRRQSAIPHAEQPSQIVGVDFVQVELKHVDNSGKVVEKSLMC